MNASPVNAPHEASAVPADATRGPDTSSRRPKVTRWFAVVMVLLALAPVVAVVVLHTGRGYLPVQDAASIDLRVRDVFSANTPLVGPYSRGWAQPGPALFWFLAPLSALAGGAAWATLVGAALLQGVAIVAGAWLAWRRGGLALLLLVLAMFALAYGTRPPLDVFVEPWNPHVALPWFVLFLFQVWLFATGSRWQAVGVAFTGSFLVQLHVGYLPLVAIAALWGVAVAFVDTRRRVVASPAWRTVSLPAALVLVVMWTPAVVQQLTGRDGNLSAMFRYFTDGQYQTAGWHRGLGVFAAQFRLPPPWLGSDETLDKATGAVVPVSVMWLIVPGALLALGFFAAHRSGQRDAHRLVTLAGVTATASIVALSRVSIELYPYMIFWHIAVAVFLVGAVAWAVAGWLRVADHRWVRRGCGAVLVGCIAVSLGARTVDVISRPKAITTLTAIEPDVRELLADIDRFGTPQQPVLLRATGTTLGGLDQALFDALDRAGAPVRADEQYAYHFGDQRVAQPADVNTIWYVSEEGRYGSLLPELPGAHLVASTTPLTPAEEHELVGRQRTMNAALQGAGRPDLVATLDSPFIGLVLERAAIPGIDLTAARRIAQLNDKVARSHRCRCSIIEVPKRAASALPYTL